MVVIQHEFITVFSASKERKLFDLLLYVVVGHYLDTIPKHFVFCYSRIFAEIPANFFDLAT